jgi:hypothetical protein
MERNLNRALRFRVSGGCRPGMTLEATTIMSQDAHLATCAYQRRGWTQMIAE